MLVASASAAAAYLSYRPPPATYSSAPPVAVPAAPDSPAARVGPVRRAEAPAGHVSALPDAQPRPPEGAAPPTVREEVAALLSIYDEMSDLMEASPEDCEALAYGLSTIIDAGARRVRGLSQRGGAASELRDPALRADALARLQRLGSAMNGVPPRCATLLNTELARMRELAAAASR